MLNGIGEVISRSDLLVPAVLVDHKAIAATVSKLEAQFWAAFDLARDTACWDLTSDRLYGSSRPSSDVLR